MDNDKIIKPEDTCVYISGFLATEDKDLKQEHIEQAFIKWLRENDFYFSGVTKKDL
jgi:hypothetical protein